MKKQSTKWCPDCGNTYLILLTSLNLKLCTDCGKGDIEWYLEEGQKSLLISDMKGDMVSNNTVLKEECKKRPKPHIAYRNGVWRCWATREQSKLTTVLVLHFTGVSPETAYESMVEHDRFVRDMLETLRQQLRNRVAAPP